MSAAIIPFPTASGRVASAIVHTGRKHTVRFARHPRSKPSEKAVPTEIRADQRLIDGARLTAHNLRQIAAKQETPRLRDAMLECAAKWDRRAAELTAAMHGPQLPPGGLFPTS